jgi:hypothetical protein
MSSVDVFIDNSQILSPLSSIEEEELKLIPADLLFSPGSASQKRHFSQIETGTETGLKESDSEYDYDLSSPSSNISASISNSSSSSNKRLKRDIIDIIETRPITHLQTDISIKQLEEFHKGIHFETHNILLKYTPDIITNYTVEMGCGGLISDCKSGGGGGKKSKDEPTSPSSNQKYLNGVYKGNSSDHSHIFTVRGATIEFNPIDEVKFSSKNVPNYFHVSFSLFDVFIEPPRDFIDNKLNIAKGGNSIDHNINLPNLITLMKHTSHVYNYGSPVIPYGSISCINEISSVFEKLELEFQKNDEKVDLQRLYLLFGLLLNFCKRPLYTTGTFVVGDDNKEGSLNDWEKFSNSMSMPTENRNGFAHPRKKFSFQTFKLDLLCCFLISVVHLDFKSVGLLSYRTRRFANEYMTKGFSTTPFNINSISSIASRLSQLDEALHNICKAVHYSIVWADRFSQMIPDNKTIFVTNLKYATTTTTKTQTIKSKTNDNVYSVPYYLRYRIENELVVSHRKTHKDQLLKSFSRLLEDDPLLVGAVGFFVKWIYINIPLVSVHLDNEHPLHFESSINFKFQAVGRRELLNVLHEIFPPIQLINPDADLSIIFILSCEYFGRLYKEAFDVIDLSNWIKVWLVCLVLAAKYSCDFTITLRDYYGEYEYEECGRSERKRKQKGSYNDIYSRIIPGGSENYDDFCNAERAVLLYLNYNLFSYAFIDSF